MVFKWTGCDTDTQFIFICICYYLTSLSANCVHTSQKMMFSVAVVVIVSKLWCAKYEYSFLSTRYVEPNYLRVFAEVFFIVHRATMSRWRNGRSQNKSHTCQKFHTEFNSYSSRHCTAFVVRTAMSPTRTQTNTHTTPSTALQLHMWLMSPLCKLFGHIHMLRFWWVVPLCLCGRRLFTCDIVCVSSARVCGLCSKESPSSAIQLCVRVPKLKQIVFKSL